MIYRFDELDSLRKAIGTKRTVATGGCFDILHQGHIELLEEAKRHGDVLVVAVHADSYVTKHKGNGRPVSSQKRRAHVLNALNAVDHVVLLPSDLVKGKLPIEFTKEFAPSVYITRRKRWLTHQNELDKVGTKIKCLVMRDVDSSSRIIDRILKLKS